MFATQNRAATIGKVFQLLASQSAMLFDPESYRDPDDAELYT